MIDTKRRVLLQSTVATGTLALATSAGLLHPSSALADWPGKAFNDTSVDAVIGDLFGTSVTTESDAVMLKAPEIAENGAVVPVTVKTSLPNVTSIAVFIEGNNRPMGAQLKLTPRVKPMFSTRVKVAKSSKVVAVVQQGDKLFSTSKAIKVTVGGCGG